MVNLDMSKYSIITLEEVPSTNGYALENMKFFEDRSVIFTTRQTSGRGRYNRKWMFDDTENIYMTIVLKPENIEAYPFPNLTQYLSTVVCKVLENEFSLEPVIKWPNDILVNGAKISGILAESYMENNSIKGIALGLGLNVNLKQETIKQIDQKAVSISILKHQNYDCEKIVRKICDTFFENYNEFIQKGFCFIEKEYTEKCFFLGKNIKISENGEKKEYFALSIDEKGFLTVKNELNNEVKILTGDILC